MLICLCIMMVNYGCVPLKFILFDMINMILYLKYDKHDIMIV